MSSQTGSSTPAIGKHWVAGAPAARLGWWDGSEWIQPPGAAGCHNDQHLDYVIMPAKEIPPR